MKMIFFDYECEDDWAFAPLVSLWQWRPEAYEVPEQADCIQVLPASHRVQIHQACHGECLQHPTTAASQRQELGGQTGYQCSTSTHWPAVVRLFASISQLKPWGSPSVGEMVVCAAISPQLYILSNMQVQCLLPLWLMHSDFGGFSNGVYHVVKVTVGENTLDPGSLTQQTWCFGPNTGARDNKMLIMTLSIDSYRGLVVSFSCSVCVESTVSVDFYRGFVVHFSCSVCVESTVSVDSYRGLVVSFSCSVCVESTVSVNSYRGLVVRFSCSVCVESTAVMYMSWPAKIKWEKYMEDIYDKAELSYYG